MSNPAINLEIGYEVHELNRKLALAGGADVFQSPAGQSLIEQALNDVARLETDAFDRLKRFAETNG